MAVNISIPVLTKGAGSPAPKVPNVIFILAKDVLAMPNVSGVVSTSNLILKEGKQAYEIEVTPRSITRNDTVEGEPADQTAGFISNFTCSRPGDDQVFNAFLQENLNEGFLILSTECGESTGGRLQGTPCNPLFMVPEGQDTVEGKMTTLTFTSGQRSKKKMIDFRHAIIVATPVPEGSGSAGGGI